jgi:hypothetical protein
MRASFPERLQADWDNPRRNWTTVFGPGSCPFPKDDYIIGRLLASAHQQLAVDDGKKSP